MKSIKDNDFYITCDRKFQKYIYASENWKYKPTIIIEWLRGLIGSKFRNIPHMVELTTLQNERLLKRPHKKAKALDFNKIGFATLNTEGLDLASIGNLPENLQDEIIVAYSELLAILDLDSSDVSLSFVENLMVKSKFNSGKLESLHGLDNDLKSKALIRNLFAEDPLPHVKKSDVTEASFACFDLFNSWAKMARELFHARQAQLFPQFYTSQNFEFDNAIEYHKSLLERGARYFVIKYLEKKLAYIKETYGTSYNAGFDILGDNDTEITSVFKDLNLTSVKLYAIITRLKTEEQDIEREINEAIQKMGAVEA